MKIPIVLIFLFSMCCSKEIDSRKILINNFLSKLKVEEVSFDFLQSNYFVADQFQDSSSTTGQHLLVLLYLKEELNSTKKIKIHKYNEISESQDNLYEIEENTQNVFVIILIGINFEKKVYCLMEDDKIKSLSVLRKGNRVIGWN